MSTRDFDELVGEVPASERSRLEHVHELLLEAGPPAELPPHLEAPNLAMTLGKEPSRRKAQRRIALIAAAVIVLLIAFLGGYITGNDSTVSGRLLKLQGTGAAPEAQASLRVDDPDPAGNWPMQLAALGLARTAAREYYEVWLVRGNNKVWLPCGSFVVHGPDVGVSVRLNAPYRLKQGDVWLVTKQRAGETSPGEIVLKPT